MRELLAQGEAMDRDQSTAYARTHIDDTWPRSTAPPMADLPTATPLLHRHRSIDPPLGGTASLCARRRDDLVTHLLRTVRRCCTRVTTPSDAGEVISAIRLGWYMAELRGRNRPEFGQARGSPSYMPSRDEHPLPLGFERTATELRIKAQTIVVALARMLNVDVADASGTRFSERATAESNHLHELRAADSPAAKECWDEFAATIYKFDAAIQDGLDVNSDSQCEGYQLGRGLAECYWALDPASPAEDGGPASWSFLLGATRCRELSRLLGRLSPYLNRYGSPAVAGSLEVWRAVAAVPTWRMQEDSAERLHQQIRVWYDIIVAGRDPSTFVRPYTRMHSSHVRLQLLRVYQAQIFFAGLGIAGAVALIVQLGSGTAGPIVSIVPAVVGLFGFSTAGITARRIREDAYADLLAVAITIAPRLPGRSHGIPWRNVRRRLLSPEAPTSQGPSISTSSD